MASKVGFSGEALVTLLLTRVVGEVSFVIFAFHLFYFIFYLTFSDIILLLIYLFFYFLNVETLLVASL